MLCWCCGGCFRTPPCNDQGSQLVQENSHTASDMAVRFQPQVRSTAHLLLLAGLVDLFYGQWTAPPGQIKLNLAFLIVGVVLYFGSARVVAWFRWLALFAVVPAVLMPIQQTLLAPAELTMVQFRLYPSQVIQFFVTLVFSAVVTGMVAWRLNSETVKASLRSHERVPGREAVPLVLGFVLMLGATAFIRHTLNGPDASRAAAMVEQKFGTKYKYFTNRLNVVKHEGTTVYATVQIWNDQEALEVPVQWRR